MKRRILVTFLCVIMVLALVPNMAFAEQFTVDAFKYEVITEPVGESHGTVKLVEVPTSISGDVTLNTVTFNDRIYDITEIYDRVFTDKSNLTSISMENCTSIGEEAFSQCTSLISVNMPALVNTGNSAFWNCTSLVTIIFGDIKTISMECFLNCTSLESVDFPETEIVGMAAFANCYNLTTVNLPKAVSIGSGAFEVSSGAGDKLISVSFPEAVSIGEGAFRFRDALVTVNLPKATAIKDEAFCANFSLSDLNIPRATSVGRSTFSDCRALTTVSLPEATSIGASAFFSCSSLTTVIIPKVEEIKDQAFFNNAALESVMIWGDAPTLIGTEVFEFTPDNLKIYVPVDASGYDSTVWQEVNCDSSLLSVSGVVADKDGNTVEDAMVNVGTSSTFSDEEGAYTVYVTDGYSGAITAEKVGIGSGAITLASVDEDLLDQSIVIAPTVTSVMVNPASVNIEKGGNQTFSATVIGKNNPSSTVEWAVSGMESASTTISTDGVLIVGNDETAATLTVTATSTVNQEMSATATVTVTSSALDTVPTEYELIEGQDSEWAKGSAESLVFTIDADYSKFIGVSVDGTELLGEDYTSESGSTIVALKATYMETLAKGQHTLRIDFSDGYMETNFTVTTLSDEPQTSDHSQVWLWFGVALLAGAGIVVTFAIRRNERQSR